jgi:hypothetical protein
MDQMLDLRIMRAPLRAFPWPPVGARNNALVLTLYSALELSPRTVGDQLGRIG